MEKQWIVVEKKWIIGIVALLVVAAVAAGVVLVLLWPEEQEVALPPEVIDPIVQPPDVVVELPQEVVDRLRIVDVDIGLDPGMDRPAVLALKADGTLWKWGENFTLITAPRHSAFPRQVGTDTNWKQIGGVSDYHYVAIKADGTLWTWGSPFSDRLAREEGAGFGVPTQVGIATNWKQASGCGALALRTDGTLWELGDDWIAQLVRDTNWTQAAGSDWGKVGIRTDGTLWGWRAGWDSWGRPRRTCPTQITRFGTDTDWERLSTCGAFVIRRDGSLWAIALIRGGGEIPWDIIAGRVCNRYGQRGLGHTDRIPYADFPIQIGTDAWKHVAASYSHTLAIRTDGTLWAWGRNHWGQLGLGHGDDRTSPVQVGTDTNWERVFAGQYFSLALKTDGTLWAWGHNHIGQLGLGDFTARLYPVQVHVGPQN